jgi:hypothetical protein
LRNWIKNYARIGPQSLNIVDLAIHGVVGQKTDFHGNREIQNSRRLDHLEIIANKISSQNKLAFQRYFGARN